jgi:hypothetical protein
LSVTIWMTRLTGTYYWVIVEAIIIIACIHAARPRDPGGLDRRPLVYLGSATVLFSLLFSPLPYGSGASTANFEVRDDRAVLSELAAAIPDDAAVSVQNNLGPHLSQRHQIATYPRRLEHSEWVLLQLRYLAGPSSGLFVRSTPRFPLGMRPVDLAGAVDELLRSPEWRLVEQRGGFYLFRRDPNGEDSAAPGFLDDVRLLGSQIDAASAHRSPLTRVAVEPLGWGDFVGAPNRNRGSR